LLIRELLVRLVYSSEMAHEGKKTGLARHLKHTMTAAERVLWRFLRGRRLMGLLFVRQQPIGPFIVDFYCATARLVIEVDGYAHNLRSKKDAERDEFLTAEGIRVLRFSNPAVLLNIEIVLSQIADACAANIVSASGPKIETKPGDGLQLLGADQTQFLPSVEGTGE
jgi:very-short-patch-repair endonuclease